MSNKSNNREWRFIQEWFQSPKGVGTMLTFFAIWAITAFNPWVAFGLFFAVFGSARAYARKRSNQLLDAYMSEDEKDSNPWVDEWSNGYQSQQTSVPETSQFDNNLEIHKKIIEEAKPDLKEIKAASGVATGDLGKNLRSIVKNSETIEHDLLSDPSKLSEVQRVFTYYLPAAADLLTARGKALVNNDDAKIAEIDLMLSRLELAFADFAARMHGEDVRSIDIDIKLLDQSLKQDLQFDIRNREKS